jgi:hypothetical protein
LHANCSAGHHQRSLRHHWPQPPAGRQVHHLRRSPTLYPGTVPAPGSTTHLDCYWIGYSTPGSVHHSSHYSHPRPWQHYTFSEC